jgi:hypothetical protein
MNAVVRPIEGRIFGAEFVDIHQLHNCDGVSKYLELSSDVARRVLPSDLKRIYTALLAIRLCIVDGNRC